MRVLEHDFVQLLRLLRDRAAPNGKDTLDFGIEQAFPQGTLADHTCSAKENDFHVRPASQQETMRGPVGREGPESGGRVGTSHGGEGLKARA